MPYVEMCGCMGIYSANLCEEDAFLLSFKVDHLSYQIKYFLQLHRLFARVFFIDKFIGEKVKCQNKISYMLIEH